jgi:hypothetical protein
MSLAGTVVDQCGISLGVRIGVVARTIRDANRGAVFAMPEQCDEPLDDFRPALAASSRRRDLARILRVAPVYLGVDTRKFLSCKG